MINRTQPRHVKSFLNTSRIRRRRRIRRNIRIGLFLLLIISIIVGFIYVCKMPKFQLKEISVLGVVKLDDSEIKQFISDDIGKNKNLFGLIQSSSTIFISETKLQKALVGQYPRIESVEVRNSLSGKLEIEIVERLGMAKWCTSQEGVERAPVSKISKSDDKSATSTEEIQDELNNIATSTEVVEESTDNQSASASASNSNTASETNPEFIGCYEFDKNGYVFDRIILDKGMNFSAETELEDGAEVVLNKDATQATEFRGIIEGNPIGQRFLDEEKFNSLLKIVQFLNSIDLKDEYVSCETTDLCTIKIAHNGVIHIDISNDIDSLTKRLKAVFESKALNGVQFKYVDARYSNKVFYK